MKRAGFAVGAALMVALLAGCSAPAVDEPIESAAPLVAESPSAQVESDSDPEQTYIEVLRAGTEAAPSTQVGDATDEQFLQAGHDACEQLAAGADVFDVRVVEGEQPTETGYSDSIRIAATALEYLCPEPAAAG